MNREGVVDRNKSEDLLQTPRDNRHGYLAFVQLQHDWLWTSGFRLKSLN
nr:MAG TPA: hypothetical protein [Bacteriophage sp.]